MLLQDRESTAADELERTISQQIVQRSWGRVRGLQVEWHDGSVTVTGRAPSYYVKQLALLAVREVIDHAPVELNIEVDAGSRRPPQGF